MTPTPPNRAQRRASQFGRRRPGERAPKGHPLEGLYVLDSARPHDPGEKAGAHIKTAQVRMCGNSVCPPLARALVAANYSDASAAAARRVA